ncbi:MAG TPA: PilW family protein [Burkholderiaceae bacterium]|nr:PilW family protein [Burkholderiaceae bacterium]
MSEVRTVHPQNHRAPGRHASRGDVVAGQRGMTLVEVMVALLLGLVTTYFISQVFAVAEGQKRTATFGSDAQVNGSVALHTLRRNIKSAGYGVVSAPSALGCPITGRYGTSGSTTAAPSMVLAPLIITPGTSASAPSDRIEVLTSTKSTFAAPVKINATHQEGDAYPSFVVLDGSSHGVKVGDTILAIPTDWSSTTKCLLLTVNEDTSVVDTTLSRTRIPHVASPSASSWNATNSSDWPVGGFQSNSLIVNFGDPRRMVFSVSGDKFQVDTWTQAGIGATEQLNSGIVLLKALYGRDTDANGTVDVYDTTTPTNNAEWRNVLSVRLAVVARSGQREKDEVTAAEPTWNAAGGAAVTYDAYPGATTACAAGAATCDLPLPISQLNDWKHYRYKVFDTAVQVRNLMWSVEE